MEPSGWEKEEEKIWTCHYILLLLSSFIQSVTHILIPKSRKERVPVCVCLLFMCIAFVCDSDWSVLRWWCVHLWGCVCVLLTMEPYGLSVSMQAARTGRCDAGKKFQDETWGAYFCLLPLWFSVLSCLYLNFWSSFVFSLLPDVFFFFFYWFCLHLFFCVFLFRLSSSVHLDSCSAPLLKFSSFFHLNSLLFSFFCTLPLSSVPLLLFAFLFSTLEIVVLASPSLSPNKINWCETIHFHIFLCRWERRVQPDLNLHVRKRI